MAQLKYPDALWKVRKYQELASELEAIYGKIELKVNEARVVDSKILEPQNVDGKYDDTYLDKRDIWISIQSKNVQKFDNFLADLKACIGEAKIQADYWSSLIGITE